MTIEAHRSPSTGLGWFALAGLFLVGAALDDACRFYPAHLPLFLPWEFSWPTFLVTFVTLGWFARGLARLPAGERPSTWRVACFLLGMFANYAVLQTRFDYLAQHMFFVHRAAHFVLHHLGPFLIALGAAGGVIRAGSPEFLKPAIDAPALRNLIGYMQHPAIAPTLFVGVIYFWLIPSIHTRAMLDSNLHDAMDWTVAINGVFFWSLVLNARPKPPARLTYGMRMLLILLVQLPQLALGAILWLSKSDVYPIYAICGRILAMTALDDQRYGALVIALPTTLMSLAALLLVATCLHHNETTERRTRESP
jgi:putative membrane protein